MKKFIIVRGIQGSGKSTWAKHWIKEDPEHRMRFNNDDVRNMLGPYWCTAREPVVKELKELFLKICMSKGMDIVVDNMNLNPKEQLFLENIVNVHNTAVLEGILKGEELYEIEYKDFFIPVEECIERDKHRPNPIGEKVIKDTWNRYKSYIGRVQAEKYLNSRIQQNPELPAAIIVDLDGTVAYNVTERSYYSDEVLNDKEDPLMVEFINRFVTSGVKVLFVTGRTAKENTNSWIKEHVLISNYELFTRQEGDFRKSEKAKSDIYEEYIKEKYYVLGVIDDDNCKMWKDKGLLCLKPITYGDK